MRKLPPSAAALYWFLNANGEVSYKNQRELADAVGIEYATLKIALKVLREENLIQREGKILAPVNPKN